MEKPRKKWSAKTEITPALKIFREKRKWQIALRRYVLEGNPSTFYAPFFGLDIKNLRHWFELQFEEGITWEDFSKKWQFDHIIPVSYFDFSKEPELKICWNFTNLRVERLRANKNGGNNLDMPAVKAYFKDLYSKTRYLPCSKLLEKIESIRISEPISIEKQKAFILENRNYLAMIESYSPFEFGLLNSGRQLDEVKKEIEFLKKLGK